MTWLIMAFGVFREEAPGDTQSVRQCTDVCRCGICSLECFGITLGVISYVSTEGIVN